MYLLQFLRSQWWPSNHPESALWKVPADDVQVSLSSLQNFSAVIILAGFNRPWWMTPPPATAHNKVIITFFNAVVTSWSVMKLNRGSTTKNQMSSAYINDRNILSKPEHQHNDYYKNWHYFFKQPNIFSTKIDRLTLGAVNHNADIIFLL